MHQFVNSRKMLIAVSMIVILVAVVLPTCRMIGCTMEMGPNGAMPGAMHLSHMSDVARLYGSCGGEYVVSDSFEGLVPTGAEALLLALMIALLGGIALLAARTSVLLVPLAYATPPPPLLDPRGERFRV